MADHRDHGLMSAFGGLADDSLSWVTHAARDAVSGVDYVSISVVHSPEHLETIGSTNPLAVKADALQYELREGPMLETALGVPLAQTSDAGADPRWPRYARRVSLLGVRGHTALRLQWEGRTIGSLNLYSAKAGLMDETALALALGIATHAAQALQMSQQVDHLIQSLTSRKAIDQAIGLIMGRRNLTRDRAFDHLVELSQARNVKLRQVAQELVDHANDKQGASAVST